MLSRVSQALPDETEDVMRRIIGCAIEVHRHLGPGYFETIYRRAMAIELEAHALSCAVERSVVVQYKGHALHGHRIDLIVESQVVVELKAVARLEPIHYSQVVAYLRATQLRAGLLINFNTRWLRDGLRRIVV